MFGADVSEHRRADYAQIREIGEYRGCAHLVRHTCIARAALTTATAAAVRCVRSRVLPDPRARAALSRTDTTLAVLVPNASIARPTSTAARPGSRISLTANTNAGGHRVRSKMLSLVGPGQMCHRPVNETVPNLMSVRSERPVSRAWPDGGGRGSRQFAPLPFATTIGCRCGRPSAPFERCVALQWTLNRLAAREATSTRRGQRQLRRARACATGSPRPRSA